jgi:hypothetical protein
MQHRSVSLTLKEIGTLPNLSKFSKNKSSSRIRILHASLSLFSFSRKQLQNLLNNNNTESLTSESDSLSSITFEIISVVKN